MKQLLFSVAAAMAVINPVWAQAYYPGSPQPQQFAPGQSQQATAAPAPGNPNSWQSLALTPRDAYREGIINRWQLEQLEGPLPQSLQGPSPDGGRNADPGM
jgi:hypothetical protein